MATSTPAGVDIGIFGVLIATRFKFNIQLGISARFYGIV